MSADINHQNSGNSNSKKRVLFIITQSDFGGAQRFLYNLLARIGTNYEVMVATGSDGGHELGDKLKSLSIPLVRLEKLKRNISPANDLKACFEIRDLIDTFKPDILFLLSSKAGFLGSFTAKFVIRNPQFRIVYRIGGWSFNDPRPAWEKKLWLKLEQKSAGWKDIIIVNSRHDLEQAKRLGIRPKKDILLIYNGLDPYKMDFLSKDEARLKIFEKISRHSGKIFQANTIIGTVANFYKTKGLEYLIETAEHFKNNPDTVFVIIGDGPMRKDLELRIANYGLEKKVYLLGQIDDGHKLMTAFDIFVLPSLKEGFPWALIEAMSAKVPSVATRVGAVPDIIENGVSGFVVEPGNSSALAGKIKELLVSDHLRKEFPIQAHQTLLFNFSEEKMVKEIEAVL